MLCGAQFVSKMSGMLQDLSVALEQNQQWGEDLGRRVDRRSTIDLKVRVLTTGNWPTLCHEDFIVPEELIGIMQQYIE